MTFSDRRGVLPTWLAGLCIAMLLSSTTAQVVDFCELNDLGDGVVFQSQPASSGSAFCLICLMAHSAAAAVLIVLFFPTFRKRVRSTVPQIRPRLFLQSFQLYVRPPPAI